MEIVSPRISVNGDSGTVRFIRRYELNTVDGQRAYSESNVTMTVRRVGQAWTITELQFVPIR